MLSSRVGILFFSLLIFCQMAIAAGDEALWFDTLKKAQQVREAGQLVEAEGLYSQALDEAKKFGDSDSRVGITLAGIATLWQYKGDYTKAEALYKEGLQIEEKTLSPNSSHKVNCLSNLGSLYAKENRKEEAIDCMTKALAMFERSGEQNCREALMLRSNLAELKNESHQDSSLAELKATLESREKLFGPVHPDVAQSLNNLGYYYIAHGQFAEAEPLEQRALAIWKNQLGRNNRLTIEGEANLAAVYFSEKKYDLAEPLMREALEQGKKILGNNHPEVIEYQNDYNQLLQAMRSDSLKSNVRY